MNLRNAVSILLTTLTLTATALCQTPVVDLVQSKKGLTVQVSEPLDMVIVLASWRNLTTAVCGHQLLADGTMVKSAMMLAAGQQIDLEVPAAAARLLAADLYVQAIGIKVAPALMLEATPAAKFRSVPDLDGGPTDNSDGTTWTEDETEVLFRTNLEWLQVSHLINDAKATSFSLYAEFTGRTSDYGLKSTGSRVVDGRKQVYLELKVPGDGEGELDVVETHRLLLDLGRDGGSTDVHVAITDGRRHTAFRPFGSYGPK